MFKVLLMSLIFLAFSACSKNETIQSSGYFTTNLEKNLRAPASTSKIKNKQSQFNNFQDTKQLLIFCKLNSKHTSSCYVDKFEKSLSLFIKRSGPLSSKDIQKIRENNNFLTVNKQFEFLDEKIMEQVNPKIENFVAKRVNFCHKNATQKIQRCLHQYVNRDTFAITNSIQRKNKTMNGQEYLYIKKKIESHLEKRLAEEKVRIKRRRSTSSL